MLDRIARAAISKAKEAPGSLPPVDLVAQHLHIFNKQGQLVPFTLNPAQKDFLARRGRRNLILKARQLGFSTVIQWDMFLKAISGLSLQATLAHDGETTAKLRRITRRFYDSLPAALKPPRSLDNATTTVYDGTGSEVTIATAGNTSAGRGGTYHRVHGSEVAFWPDANAIMAGLLQGVPENGEIDLESTPNGAQGYFFDTCMEALSGKSVWQLFFYEWWWAPEYRTPLEDGEDIIRTYVDEELALVEKHNLLPEQIKWRREKRKELKHLFPQEYPEGIMECFLRGGAGYFGDIGFACRAPLGAEPQEGHRYIAGLDFGQMHDYTALSIWDKTAKCQVALMRIHKLPWAEIRRRIRVTASYWGCAAIYAEENSIGKVNLEALKAEFREHEEDVFKRPRIISFHTTNLSKAAIMADLHEALHSGEWALLPDPDQKREMEAFTSKRTPTGMWQLQAPSGSYDDTVIANALACYGCHRPATISFEMG